MPAENRFTTKVKEEVMRPLIERLYRLLIQVGSSLQSPFLLFVRLYWGWQLIETGWGKLHTLDKVTDFFASLGIPAPALNATFVASLEFVGGILLVLGLASRLIAVPLVINLTVAYLTADREALGSFFSNPDKFYAAAPYTFLFAALLVLIFGPGRFSLDALLARRMHWQTESAPSAVAARL
jgi:putative oxidoreductase